jgi:hypothetical protein
VSEGAGTDQTGAPEAPQTGDRRVDDALRQVADLDQTPVDEHAERLADAYGALQEVLRNPAEPQP